MKKNIKFLVISMLLIAVSMTNAISAKAEVNIGDNLLKDLAINTDNNPDVPKPVEVDQLSANVIEITFNIPVDKDAATKASNYWVRSTEEEKPSGIATLGKNDKLSASNSLTDDMVKIEPSGESGKDYRMTFKNNIKSGAKHKIHIYFIAAKGAEAYKGENGEIIFKAK